jgi:hypothetical protein
MRFCPLDEPSLNGEKFPNYELHPKLRVVMIYPMATRNWLGREGLVAPQYLYLNIPFE